MKYQPILTAAISLALNSLSATVTFSISGGTGDVLRTETTQEIVFNNVPTGIDDFGFVLVDALPENTTTSVSRHSGDMAWSPGSNISTGGMGARNHSGLFLDDLFISWGDPVETTVPTMTLLPGYRETDQSLDLVAPQGLGNFEIRMFDFATSEYIGSPGVVVPEPLSSSLLLSVAALVFVANKRKRSVNQPEQDNPITRP